jgi:hypothetical protein
MKAAYRKPGTRKGETAVQTPFFFQKEKKEERDLVR